MADITLPEPQQALGVLDAVYADVFFSKMAEYGFQPQSDAEAMNMLETAVILDAVEQEPAVKTAEATDGGPFARANTALKEVLAANGLDTNIKQANALATADRYQQHLFALAQDPTVYASALAVKAAQVEALDNLAKQEAKTTEAK